MLLTWYFVELFLHSEKSIVHNRKFVPNGKETDTFMIECIA